MMTSRCLFKGATSALICVVFVFMLAPAAQSTADQIKITYDFAAPLVQTVEIDGQQFSEVTMPGCPPSGAVGSPALPTKRARVLLPYGHRVKSVAVNRTQKHLVASGLRLVPVEQPFPLSTPPDQVPPLYVNEEIYATNQPLPNQTGRLVSEQVFHGYRIALIDLVPVEYLPSTGELHYYSKIELTVTTISTSRLPAVRGIATDAEALSSRVDNASLINTYGSASKVGTRSYDMLIITSSALASAFQPLKDYHDGNGIATEIRTLDQIGSNDPHTVRDYIRNEYLTSGIRLVLLGGDDDIIPALDLYVNVTLSSGSITAYDMPGDFYFACLDGTFNYDGDGWWGEPGDGEDGGEIDLLPEIGLGRVSAGDATEVANLINKTIIYLESNDDYLSKVLLVGEDLGFGGLGEYGGYAMNEMVNGSDAHGFTTYGFAADQYNIEKLYDLTSLPYNYWPPSELIARINEGVHIVDHLGHSNIGYAMRTDTSMVKSQLTNTDYCFLYAEGCSAGRFDFYDGWAEYVTTKLSTGGFACVANSRAGLGSRTTQHPVHVFNREFWDAIYSADEGCPELGMAMLDARFDLASRINEPAIRWTYYETNLFADPAVRIKTVRSLAIMFPNGTPTQVEPKTETTFDVTVTGIGEGAPLTGSGLLHYQIDGSDSTAVPLVSSVRQEQYQAVLPSLDCGQTIEYFVSFDESEGRRCYAPPPTEPLVAMPVSEEVMVFEDSFEDRTDWTMTGLWDIGIPLGQGGQEQSYPVPDPTEGCLGTSVLGYNLAGDYENNLAAQHATSPAIDCSESIETRLRFCRWLGVEQPVYDKATVSISTNGTDWTTLWQNPAIISDLEWMEIEYDISEYADNQPTVYLRWTMGPTDGGLRFCGWNIDNIRVVSMFCQTWICGNIDNIDGPAGPVDVSDLTYIVAYLFSGGPPPPVPEAANVDGITGPGGMVDVADLTFLVAYLFNGGPEPVCE